MDLYQDLVENSLDLIFECDDHGVFTYLNPAWTKVLGYPTSEMIGRPYTEFQPAQTPAFVFNCKAQTDYQTQLVAKSGSIVHVIVNARVCFDAEGKYLHTRGTAHDITKRVRMEIALQESEERFRLHVENSSDIIFALDLQGNFLYVSPVWKKHFGTNVADILGTSFVPQVHPDDVAPLTEYLGRCLASETMLMSPRYRVRCADGRYLPFVANGSRYVDPHGKVQFLGVGRDITEQIKVEEALRVSERMFADMAANSSGVIYQFYVKKDGSTGFHYVSPKCETMLGMSSDVNSPDWKNMGARLHPDDVDGFMQTMGAAIHEMHEFNFEARQYTPDGVKWIQFLSQPMKTDDEIVFNGIMLDVTERHQLDEQRMAVELVLEERTRFMESLIDIYPGMLYIYDVIEQRSVYANDGVSRILGYSEDEVFAFGDHLLKTIMHPDDYQNYIQHTVPRYSSASDTDQIITQYRVKDAQGSWRWIESTEMIYKRTSDGRAEHVFGTGFDITKRKIAEDRLSALFGAMTEMVVLHDLVLDEQGVPINYRITDCNHAFTNITGITKESATGKLATEVYHTNDAPYLLEYAEVALTGKSLEYETYFAPMDRYFSVSVVCPQKNSFATITTDISDIKRAQDAITAKNKELETYLYVASHDLRAPLLNINGFSQMLEGQVADVKSLLNDCEFAPGSKSQLLTLTNEEIPTSMKFICSSVTKMESLIRGLLQISRTGRMSMNIVRVNMNALFETILIDCKYQMDEIAATVHVDDLPECFGDMDQLNQLFSNLIHNAIKYRSLERHLHIHITGQSDGSRITYRIRDNGIGIEARHLTKIWDVFYRVNPKSVVGGEGLGLSVIRRIAEKHHGLARVESEYGQGSSFYVELLAKPFSE